MFVERREQVFVSSTYVDLQDERRVWFVDTERWNIHYFFARDRLATVGHPIEDHGAFNVQEYRREDRRFEMGSVVHYLDSDLWTMEMVSGDTLSGERIVRLFGQIQAAVWTGAQMRFHPVSPVHEASIAAVRDRIPTIASSEVFRGVGKTPDEKPAVVAQEDGRVCLPVPPRANDDGARDDDRSRYVVVRLANGATRGPLVMHFYDLGPRRGLRLVGIERPES